MKKEELKKYTIYYRDEFFINVKAKNREEAILKAKQNEKGWAIISDLWSEFISVTDEKGFEIKE